jgi:CheY-like chemotaxis protein
MSSTAYSQQDVARASLQQLTELSRRANRTIPTSNLSPTVNSGPPTASHDRMEGLPRLQTSPDASVLGVNPQQQQHQPQQIASPSQMLPAQSPLDWSSHKGLQVLTVGHLLPRNAATPTTPNPQEDMELEEQVMPSSSYSQPQPPASNRLRVRRKTYVPGWAVPPRVLLVEDDAVSRKLSSKFLQVLGVTADVAVDGDAAVKQMCLERYDLVLMVNNTFFSLL